MIEQHFGTGGEFFRIPCADLQEDAFCQQAPEKPSSAVTAGREILVTRSVGRRALAGMIGLFGFEGLITWRGNPAALGRRLVGSLWCITRHHCGSLGCTGCNVSLKREAGNWMVRKSVFLRKIGRVRILQHGDLKSVYILESRYLARSNRCAQAASSMCP